MSRYHSLGTTFFMKMTYYFYNIIIIISILQQYNLPHVAHLQIIRCNQPASGFFFLYNILLT